MPIILRSCLFNEAKFKYPDPKNGPEELSLSTLQVANSPTKAMNSMIEHEQDKVLLSVAQRILKIVNEPVKEQFFESKNASFPQPSVQILPDTQQNRGMSRGRQFQIRRLQQEIGKIEQDYRDVAEKKNQPHMLRGGSWRSHPRVCRSAFRGINDVDLRNFFIGFRVVCAAARTV